MIDLPTWPEPASAEPYFLDAGGWQLPSIAAANAIRMDRLGDKHGLAVRLPAMKFNDPAGVAHARVWIQRLKRGLSEGVRMKFPTPDYVAPFALATLSAAPAAQAVLIAVAGLPGGVTVPEGLFFGLKKLATGTFYLHSVNTQVVASGGGAANLSVHPRLRTSFSIADQVICPPQIEGRLVGDRQSWTLENARTVGLEFQIEERQ
jgi:hypothetical protein